MITIENGRFLVAMDEDFRRDWTIAEKARALVARASMEPEQALIEARRQLNLQRHPVKAAPEGQGDFL